MERFYFQVIDEAGVAVDEVGFFALDSLDAANMADTWVARTWPTDQQWRVRLMPKEETDDNA